MEIKNQQFQQPISELLQHPFRLLGTNASQFFSWILSYYTIPVFVLGCIALATLLIKKFKAGSILFLLWFGPMLVLAVVGREVFPRYIVFVTPYFLISIAYVVDLVSKNVKLYKFFVFGVLAALFLPLLHLDYSILTDPPSASLPKADYNQFISEHSSGYGLDKIFTFLDREAKEKKITIVTQGTFGLYPYAFQLHYWDNKNVSIIPVWPLDVIEGELYALKKHGDTYFILKEHEFIPGHLLLKEIIKAEKPGSKKYPIYLTTFL